MRMPFALSQANPVRQNSWLDGANGVRSPRTAAKAIWQNTHTMFPISSSESGESGLCRGDSCSVFVLRSPRAIAEVVSAALTTAKQVCHDPSMTSLREFLSVRRAELEKTLAALDEQRSPLLAELFEIEAAEKALAPDGLPNTDAAEEADKPANPTAKRSREIRPGSIKDKVMAVLRNRPMGADANEILELIANQFGEAIERTSLSPQLSRLKKEEWLVLDGNVWRVADKNEAPDVGASGASEVGEVGTSPNESQEDDLFG